MDTLKLGFGRADFTPAPPVPLNSTTMGTEVIDRLFVSCLAWQDESTTVLLVEQNAGKSLAISDRAYVMENGSIVLSGTGAELAASEQVRKAYLGG